VGLPEIMIQRSNFSILWVANANTIPAAFWAVYHIMGDAALRARVLDEVQRVFRQAQDRTGLRTSPLFASFCLLSVICLSSVCQ